MIKRTLRHIACIAVAILAAACGGGMEAPVAAPEVTSEGHHTGSGEAGGQASSDLSGASSCLSEAGLVTDIRFEFPLKADSGLARYFLVTEAGGQSSDPSPPAYFDNFHTGGGYYSLDFVSEGFSKVVAAQSGLVVRVDANRENSGPTITLYHGNGFFTEYREFTAPTVTARTMVNTGDQLGTYRTKIDGDPIGTGDTGNRGLHFQVKYCASLSADSVAQYAVRPDAYTGSLFGIGLSADKEGSPLRNVRLGDALLSQWQLVEVGGIPQRTLVDPRGPIF